ncbi:MAG: hypothetical protein P4L50_04585 [Anaerolineaceae bacterium]|nr:hypothetical protein [Anaerolineaceae bacterium]
MIIQKVVKLIWFAGIVLPLVFMSACAAAAPSLAPNTLAAQAAAPTTPPVMPSDPPTALPTTVPAAPTLAPTLPPAPTTPPATPTALPQAGQLNVWCMPVGYLPSLVADKTVMPAAAKTGTLVNGVLSFQVPFSYCTVVYTFAQAEPAGTTLQLYDLTPTPWLKVPLQVSASNPNIMYAVLRHSYIIDPPLWTTTYRFVVYTPDGTKIKEDKLTFHKYTPAVCWNGLLPNPTNLTCIKEQDIHPWDAGYPIKYYNCYNDSCVK